MSFSPPPHLSRHRPLSAQEIAAIAAATVMACPAPRNVPGGIDRLRRVDGPWRRRQVEAVENDAQPGRRTTCPIGRPPCRSG
jgi:hypothetical protein